MTLSMYKCTTNGLLQLGLRPHRLEDLQNMNTTCYQPRRRHARSACAALEVLTGHAGPELAAAAMQLFCLEAAVARAAAADGLEGEEQAAVSRAVVEALLDGSTLGLMAPSLRGLYQRALARRVAEDPVSKVLVFLSRAIRCHL